MKKNPKINNEEQTKVSTESNTEDNTKKPSMEETEEELLLYLQKFRFNPLGYTLLAFRWGETDSDLVDCSGPDTWQREFLKILGEESAKTRPKPIAVASGHGVGKTACSAWAIKWFLDTHPNGMVVVTANTRTQLITKTWRELKIWHDRSITKQWWKHSTENYRSIENPTTWCASAIPWSEERSDAFAGTHSKHVMVIFDEASIISDKIWEVTEGAMTTKGALWIAFGNPTQNTGRFRECWGKFSHRWRTLRVDSRSAKMTDKELIKNWIEDYGEDHDFVRVRVKGTFPRASSLQFISSELVEEASKRHYEKSEYRSSPIVIGVDVAREGDDETVIIFRQGLQVLEMRTYRDIKTDQTVSFVWKAMDDCKNLYGAPCRACFVDGVGPGIAVIDRMNQLGRPVEDVRVGLPSSQKRLYGNQRAEFWSKMKLWLQNGGAIPNDDVLKSDLTNVQYGYSGIEQIVMEKKKDMKDHRGLKSPDRADALMLTFAINFEPLFNGDDEFEYDYAEYDSLDLHSKGRDAFTGY